MQMIMSVEDINNKSNCSTVSMVEAPLIRGIIALVCFIICVMMLLFEIINICRSRKTKALRRLYIYLTVSTMLYTGSLSLEIAHYSLDLDSLCKAIGFLCQYTGSIQLLLMLGITFVLFHKFFSLCEPYRNIVSKFEADVYRKRVHCRYCLELGLCFTSVLLPWTVVWIPFLHTEGGYGESGPWCWIQSKDPSTCKEIPRGVLEQILLWYAPFGLIAIISILCIFCVITFLCYLRFYLGILVQHTQTVIKEMILLMVFLGIFCVVCIVEITTRTVVNNQVNIANFWNIYAIMAPIGSVVAPVGFFVYFFCSKHLASSSSSSHKISTQTGKAGDHFLHNPSRISQPSNTSDRDSRFFVSKNCSVDSEDSYTQTQSLLTPTTMQSYASYSSMVEKT